MLLDEHVRGMIDELEQQGCLTPDRSNLRILNAQGDHSLSAAIAREAVDGSYELLLTSSTMSLQSVANANKNHRKPHIFGAVTDPYGTGTGINGTRPEDHPPWLAGIGTFQPVEELFRLVSELNPLLKQVGVVWNPAEQCSTACLIKARTICRELDIELAEANATNAAEVGDALRALLSKGVEAVWIGGDTVATSTAQFIIRKAADVDVPVITNDPRDVKRGALIGLGADYYTVGRYTGALAAEVIHGRSLDSVAVENVVPQKLRVNRLLMDSLAGWTLTASVVARLEPAEVEKIKKIHQVALINLVHAPGLDAAEKGLIDAFSAAGFKEARDYTLKRFNAQGDIAIIAQLIDAALVSNPELILTLTTPVLIASAHRIKDIPVIYTVASNPADLELGKGGLPDSFCGVYEDSSARELIDMAREHYPSIRKIGTLYNSAEPNARLAAQALRFEANADGLVLEEIMVSCAAELSMAVQSLIQRGAEAIFIGSDNLTTSSFPAIIKAAAAQQVPVYANEPEVFKQGAAGVVGCDYYDWGFQAGELAVQVLGGTAITQLKSEPQRSKISKHRE